ncbi:MAG: N-methyl-L-tryptophan oxidase [Rhodothermales bacterium]
MNTTSDAIVVGLGAVGSAAAYHLARRGLRVIGLDRFAPPHPHGSSHGDSRIIRKAYFEGARYLPLIERAYVLWRELETATGQPLLRITGGLHIGPPTSDVVEGARRTAQIHNLHAEMLTSEDVQARFPMFRLPEGHVGLWEAEAGVLDAEACLQTHLAQACRHGAVVRIDEPVLRWQAVGSGVQVKTDRATYHADRLVLCAGGWIRDLLPELGLPLHIERQVNGWFRPRANAPLFDSARCPVYIWAYAPDAKFYGFPDLGRGLKVGLHHQGQRVDHPDALDRTPTPTDEAAMRAPLRRLLPDADGRLLRTATCFYTNTPDQHYLIDVHPDHPQVAFASACSGHGFKASGVVGEALADLVTGIAPQVPLDAFRWNG